jgi:hypothetical protein
VPVSRKQLPLAETLDRQLMWMDAFGFLGKDRLKENSGIWSPEVMDQACIRSPKLDKVQGFRF